jgi:hypothetical protein
MLTHNKKVLLTLLLALLALIGGAEVTGLLNKSAEAKMQVYKTVVSQAEAKEDTK